jgi:hypothetical protein
MDSTAIRRRLRLAAWVFTIGALWLATSAPFFQGPALHW